MVHHTTRSTNNDLYTAFQRTDLFSNLLPSVDWKNLNTMHGFCQIM